MIPNKNKIYKYREILSKHKFQKFVGISWKSSNVKSSNKSLRLNDLKPLFANKNLGFVNLQYGNNSELKAFNIENNNLCPSYPDCVEEYVGIQDINDCINCEGDSVELWGQCYDIATTTSLSLYSNGLVGQIPPQIGYLTNLLYLSLMYNDLSGEIPSEIGYLTNLGSLYLNYNLYNPVGLCEDILNVVLFLNICFEYKLKLYCLSS